MLHTIFQNSELANIMLCGFNMAELMSFAHTSRERREVVKGHVTRSVRFQVRPFFLKEADYRRFFKILAVSQGLITGSVALAVLLPNGPRLWAPHNLNIVLPADRVEEMVAFVEHIGYMQAHSFSAQGNAFKRIYYYVTNDDRKPIVLGESKDCYALSSVLASCSSGLMNILDGTTCVSFYPKLTLAGICRGGDVQGTHEVIRFGEQGLEFRRHSGGGLALCGYSCAKLWRPVRGLRGIGTFQWGAMGQMQEDTYWTAPLKWRLGGKCDNIFCANME